MKIRMKKDHTQVREAHPIDQRVAYIIQSGWTDMDHVDGMIIPFSQQDWEPVPEERWVNVTEECEVITREDGKFYLSRNDKDAFGQHAILLPGLPWYRLRKVNLHSLNASHELSSVVSAFIVEKKEA